MIVIRIHSAAHSQEEGKYGGRDAEEDARDEDEGVSGGSGTEAGGCKRRRIAHHLTPEAELTPPPLGEEELLEDEDNVVSSLRKLKEGPPRRPE